MHPSQRGPVGYTRRSLMQGMGAIAATGVMPSAAWATTSHHRHQRPHRRAEEPCPATTANYDQLAFYDDFASADTIDVQATNQPGYNWYVSGYHNQQNPVPPDDVNVSESILTLGGGSPHGSNVSIKTAIPNSVDPYYTGSVFGGGAYFEARMAFDPTLGVNVGAGGHPAFWSEAIEHVYDKRLGQPLHPEDEQWPGQPSGYIHYAEMDFMEAYRKPFTSYAGKTYYDAAIHDWSGEFVDGHWQYNIQNSGNLHVNTGAVDWNDFHTYGWLWVPQDGDSPGFVQRFFDDQPGPLSYWLTPIGDPPLPGQTEGKIGNYTPDTPDKAAATYAITDLQRFAVILKGHPLWPLRVDWVKVWQS